MARPKKLKRSEIKKRESISINKAQKKDIISFDPLKKSLTGGVVALLNSAKK